MIDNDIQSLEFREQPEFQTTEFVETNSQRLIALSKALSVVQDVFIKDIDQKDRIIQKTVDNIEEILRDY